MTLFDPKSVLKLSSAFGAMFGVALLMGVNPAAAAGNNNPAPTGAFLDLSGQAVNHGTPVVQSGSFVAALASTDFTMAFREDPAFFSLYDVRLVDTTTGSSANILTNGDFSGGVYTSNGNALTPVGWEFANVYGATAFGKSLSCPLYNGLTHCWYDGSVQAYDAIDQVVTTTVGDTYTLSFAYTDNSGLSTYSQLSTNGNTTNTGGNGIDILAYALAGLPPAGNVPEPGSLALLGSGLAGLIALGRRRVLAAK